MTSPLPADLRIVDFDDELIIVEKPAGMLVHPTQWVAEGTVVQLISDQFGPVSLIHRLDRDTSGLLALARTPLAHTRFARQFEQRTVSKRYVAVVHGVVTDESRTIDLPIGRVEFGEPRWQVHPQGKTALTELVVRARGENFTEVGLTPHTGRTHQLRIHCAALSHPIAGDTSRGGLGERLYLHAAGLALDVRGERKQWESTIPEVFRALVRG